MATAQLSGRVMAITGGARGIGVAIARAGTAAGMRVVVGDLDAEAVGCPKGQVELVEFVRGLGLPADVEERLAVMTPATYVGLAPELVDHLR